MSKLPRLRLVFEEGAGEFILSLPRRRQRKLVDITYAIAESPYVAPDYTLPDADGRPISHVSTEGYLIGYWVDSAVKRIVIVEIEKED